jgi:hypothetical protein
MSVVRPWWGFVQQPRYKAIAFPDFYIVTVNDPFGGFHRFLIAVAYEVVTPDDVTIIVEHVCPILRHDPPAPLA